ncbi:hypothetical protein GBAR_LOCUS27002 [Geodia barretti]|uniref:Uncharacterized protein n=1 Tax=Geodia barretti TaxID=519541 RepID=A0AA35TK34_GEOBA|nr:hypothetical protein GBAR_LOCUS27002 [Geodia barretti]
MVADKVEIYFNVQLEIVNGTNLSNTCVDYYYLDYGFDTFCPSNSSDYHWKLCYLPYEYGYSNILQLTFSPQTFNIEPYDDDYDDDDDDDYPLYVSMTLVMDTLDCNPPIPMTQCALSELLSWIKVYSEFGGKSHTFRRDL